MKTVVQIFATFFFVCLILGSALMVAVNFREANAVEDLRNNVFGRIVVDAMLGGSIAHEGTWRFAAILWMLLVLGSVVAIASTFLKRHKFGIILAASLILLSIILMVVQPSLPATESDDVDPKMIGIVFALFGLLATALLLLRHTVLKEKSIEAV